jgi:hypothetical protein
MADCLLRLAPTCCIAFVAASAATWTCVFAATLEVGHGYGASPAVASADARTDLALRLQRRIAAQVDEASGKEAASVKRAIAGGRELPLLRIELASSGARGAEVLYQARLTDASLAGYEREAMRLAERLRRLDPAKTAAAELDDTLARLDQYVRVKAVLGLFSSAQPDARLDETVLWSSAVRRLPRAAGAQDVARRVKLELDKSAFARCRIVAPVAADTTEVTALSASVADELAASIGPAAPDSAPACTLDGRFAEIDGRVLLMIYLQDASFNTQRAFAFVLPAAAEQRSPSTPAARSLAAALNRGLVRVDLPNEGTTAPAGGRVMGVNARMGRGSRGLYYRPGETDKLLVKLDRPGYYYIVGHVQKEAERFSYLMEIGEQGAGERFVRRVAADQVQRWQTVVEFTVEAPVGLEAVQVFAISGPPEGMLPATRFDPARKLYLVGTDPADTINRTRGLVLVSIPDPSKTSVGKTKAPPLAVGEAVLQFSTLP